MLSKSWFGVRIAYLWVCAASERLWLALCRMHSAGVEKGETMAERKRFCVNCGNNIRTEDIKFPGIIQNHCAIDSHRIGYVECFEGWCRRWKKDPWQEANNGEGKNDREL